MSCRRLNAGCFLGMFALWGYGFLGMAQEGSGLKTSVAVDLLAEFEVKGDRDASDQLLPREVEIMMLGPIDHLFDGLLSLAAHPEGGEVLFELHEATISSSRLIPRSRFRLGQFFLGVGRLNQIHRHDWPFISAPYVHEHFFASEGVLDSGVEYSVLLPLPFYLDFTLGVTNGYTYGHSHSEGKKPRKPTHYARIATSLGSSLIGVNYLGRRSADDTETTLVGMDYVFKSRLGKTLSWLVQSELWQRRVHAGAISEDEVSCGGYIFGQYGFTTHLLFGLRGDYFTVTSAQDAVGRPLSNKKQAIVPTMTWAPSEFSRFRLAYEFFEDFFEGSAEKGRGKKSQTIQFQSTFILGAHPAHDF